MARSTTLLMLASVMATGLCVSSAPGSMSPSGRGAGGQLRPESGRDRHNRRRRAMALAGQHGLDVEDIYRALGSGQTEAQVVERARLARERATESVAVSGRSAVKP